MMYRECISIHAPRGGSDIHGKAVPPERKYFNPRSPWGERPAPAAAAGPSARFQSTLPVGGATGTNKPPNKTQEISIHAPRGGSDVLDGNSHAAATGFQSTLPVGGATVAHSNVRRTQQNFNPRSPWGERQFWSGFGLTAYEISIHAPRGGSDLTEAAPEVRPEPISIHAPRGGSDLLSRHPRAKFKRFQSTLPVGGATVLVPLLLLL